MVKCAHVLIIRTTIGLEIPHMSVCKYGGSGCNHTKLSVDVGMIKWTLILQEVPPQNLGGQNCQKFGAIFDNFRC